MRRERESVYAQVAAFYARQGRLLDEGDAVRWAATFTEEAVFRLSTRPEPMRGRAQLEAGARAAADALAAAGERRRHMSGMFEIEERPGTALEVRAYTVVYATAADGRARVDQVCTCTDILVRDASGAFLVQERRIDVDGPTTP